MEGHPTFILYNLYLLLIVYFLANFLEKFINDRLCFFYFVLAYKDHHLIGNTRGKPSSDCAFMIISLYRTYSNFI